MTDADCRDVLEGRARWAMVEGDAATILPAIPAGCADAVITDPPYGVSYQSAWRSDRTAWKPKLAGDDAPCLDWLPDAYRATRDGGALLCFCAWQTQEAFRQAIVAAGFAVRSHVVWDRLWHGMGDLTASFAPSHDIIWFATKGRYTFPGERPSSVIRARRRPADALEHPTEKPIPLMAQLVKAVVPAGGLVLDPFAGSGATGVACSQNGYRFIGVEIDAAYAQLARRRIEGTWGPLFSALEVPA